MNVFKKAVRKQIKIKLAITGPTGSGKTYSALRLARGLGLKIAVIDTENGSASLYSDKFDFDVLEIKPPFETEKYIEAINQAVANEYDVVVIDSITHAWALEGGLLSQKEQIDARGGNSYTNWAKITKKQDQFMSAILQAPINTIVTMRSKMAYELVQGSDGKSKPQKMGLAPQQRDGVEYEYSIVFDVGMTHEAETSKDRTGLFTDKIFKITEDTGKTIKTWLESGKNEQREVQTRIETDKVIVQEQPKDEQQASPTPATASEKPKNIGPSDKQLKRLFALKNKAKWTDEQVKTHIKEMYGCTSSRDLRADQYKHLCDLLDAEKSYLQAKDAGAIY